MKRLGILKDRLRALVRRDAVIEEIDEDGWSGASDCGPCGMPDSRPESRQGPAHDRFEERISEAIYGWRNQVYSTVNFHHMNAPIY